MTLSVVKLGEDWLKFQIFLVSLWIKLWQGFRTCSCTISLCLPLTHPTVIFLNKPHGELLGDNIRKIICPNVLHLPLGLLQTLMLLARSCCLTKLGQFFSIPKKNLHLYPVSICTQTRYMPSVQKLSQLLTHLRKAYFSWN